jgi:hypothetical protein
MDENAPYSMSRNLPSRNTGKCRKINLKIYITKHHNEWNSLNMYKCMIFEDNAYRIMGETEKNGERKC